MKKINKTIVCTCLCLFSLLFVGNYSSAQDGEGQGIEMEDGWKMKTTKDRNVKLSSDFDLDAEDMTGNLGFELSTTTTLSHWCKQRRNRSCPRAYFDIE